MHLPSTQEAKDSRNFQEFKGFFFTGVPWVDLEVVAKVGKREKMLSLQAKEADNVKSKNKKAAVSSLG